MKVEGPDRARQASQTKKTGKVSGDGTFGEFLTGNSEGAQSAGPAQSVARLDALLAAQSVDSPTERAARRRMRERGVNLLNELEKIRVGLLTGNVTLGHLVDIADVVASHREKVMDPRLTAILDEIDLRAQVELAKLRVAMDNNP